MNGNRSEAEMLTDNSSDTALNREMWETELDFFREQRKYYREIKIQNPCNVYGNIY